MIEYEVYLPATRKDGTPINARLIEDIKERLAKAFGGYTHLTHRNAGAWRIGRVVFYDEITIVRVLDDGTAHFDMASFRQELEEVLQQESVLVVAREIRLI